MASRLKGIALAAGVIAVCSIGVHLRAQATQGQATTQIKRGSARVLSSVVGKDTYIEYCAACHGIAGTGNGPAAPALKVAPTNLTRLAAANKGKFDPFAVEQLILGRGKIPPSHGGPDMPIWGPVFHSTSSSSGDEVLRVHNLVKYLESIQTK